MKALKILTLKAQRLIKTQGFFLLHYDVVGSQKFAEKSGYKFLYDCLKRFHKAMNKNFKKHIATVEIGIGRKSDKFGTIIGDSGGAYFSDLKVIKPIVDLANKMLPFKLRWGVARDGWDKKNFEKKNMKIAD